MKDDMILNTIDNIFNSKHVKFLHPVSDDNGNVCYESGGSKLLSPVVVISPTESIVSQYSIGSLSTYHHDYPGGIALLDSTNTFGRAVKLHPDTDIMRKWLKDLRVSKSNTLSHIPSWFKHIVSILKDELDLKATLSNVKVVKQYKELMQPEEFRSLANTLLQGSRHVVYRATDKLWTIEDLLDSTQEDGSKPTGLTVVVPTSVNLNKLVNGRRLIVSLRNKEDLVDLYRGPKDSLLIANSLQLIIADLLSILEVVSTDEKMDVKMEVCYYISFITKHVFAQSLLTASNDYTYTVAANALMENLNRGDERDAILEVAFYIINIIRNMSIQEKQMFSLFTPLEM